MKKIKQYIKQLFCKHKYEHPSSWDINFYVKCKKCGKNKLFKL